MPTTEIRRIDSPADVHAAAMLFDGPPRADATDRFLNDPGHHLLIAYVDGQPVGMVTGVEMTHPDKGTAATLAAYQAAGGIVGDNSRQVSWDFGN